MLKKHCHNKEKKITREEARSGSTARDVNYKTKSSIGILRQPCQNFRVSFNEKLPIR